MVNVGKCLILVITLHSNFGVYLEDLTVCSTLPGSRPVFENQSRMHCKPSFKDRLIIFVCSFTFSASYKICMHIS